MRKHSGFSLLELLIAIAILAIITVVAIASYGPYVRKGRRVDGINALLQISLAQERYRANNTTYGTLAQAYNSVTSSPEGYYTLAVSNVTATSYTATATAVGNQANDTAGSTSCATLTLAMSNGTITKTPAECWPS